MPVLQSFPSYDPADTPSARQRHPHLRIELLEYFGNAGGLVSLVRDHIDAQS